MPSAGSCNAGRKFAEATLKARKEEEVEIEKS